MDWKNLENASGTPQVAASGETLRTGQYAQAQDLERLANLASVADAWDMNSRAPAWYEIANEATVERDPAQLTHAWKPGALVQVPLAEITNAVETGDALDVIALVRTGPFRM